MKSAQETVTLPKKSLFNFLEAARNFEAFQDEIEDFLLAGDREFLKKMRRAKKESVRGKMNWEELRKRYV